MQYVTASDASSYGEAVNLMTFPTSVCTHELILIWYVWFMEMLLVSLTRLIKTWILNLG